MGMIEIVVSRSLVSIPIPFKDALRTEMIIKPDAIGNLSTAMANIGGHNINYPSNQGYNHIQGI